MELTTSGLLSMYIYLGILYIVVWDTCYTLPFISVSESSEISIISVFWYPHWKVHMLSGDLLLFLESPCSSTSITSWLDCFIWSDCMTSEQEDASAGSSHWVLLVDLFSLFSKQSSHSPNFFGCIDYSIIVVWWVFKACTFWVVWCQKAVLISLCALHIPGMYKC